MEKSKGLGDSIERFTKATGIKSLVQMGTRAIGKKGCGWVAWGNTDCPKEWL